MIASLSAQVGDCTGHGRKTYKTESDPILVPNSFSGDQTCIFLHFYSLSINHEMQSVLPLS